MVRPEDVAAAEPDMIVVACCGQTAARAQADIPVAFGGAVLRTLRCVREGRVFVVDGSAYFNRPGPRLVDSLEILAHAIAPDRHPLPDGLSAAERIRLGG